MLSQWAGDAEGWVWADFEAEDATVEAQLVERHLGQDALVVADAQHPRHPPKPEAFDGYSAGVRIRITPTRISSSSVQSRI